jgi:hypothetical protein
MVKNKILFDLNVQYSSPSKEKLFLGSGWGVRDVRGPYLAAEGGNIAIGCWALSPEVPSRIHLQFEMSNRSALEAAVLCASGTFGTKTCYIIRNKIGELMIENALSTIDEDYLIKITQPRTLHSARFDYSLSDLIAVNALRIWR